MVPKKGTVVPKTGTVLHQADGVSDSVVDYAGAIAAALRQELGMSHQAIKSAMRWTDASERTVKYWFAGTRGPSGAHLITLARHSDFILEVFLRRAGRQNYVGALRLLATRDKLGELLGMIHSIIDEDTDS